MKKSVVLLFAIYLLITVVGTVSAQNVQVVSKFPATEVRSVKTFDFIDCAFDLEGRQKIVILRGFFLSKGKHTVVSLFNSFWEKANSLGGNAFTLDSISNAADTTSIILTVYYLAKEDVKSNKELYPKNMVYVIGDIDKKPKAKSIELNEQKLVLNPMEYIAYQNAVGGTAVVGIGGLLGAKVWISGKEGRLPEYLSVSGFSVGPGSAETLGVSFNTGRIYPVSMSFGQFLVRVLKEQK